MKIGMPILYEFDNLEDNFKLAKRLGFDFIELNLNFSYCRKGLLDYEYLYKLISFYNIEITLHFFDEADFGTYETVSESYYELLILYTRNAIKCGLKNLVIHLIDGPVVTISGVKNYIYEKEFDEYSHRLLKILNKINEYCIQNNVTLCIENSKLVPYMTKTYELLISNNYSFTFDIGHNLCSDSLLDKIYDEKKFDIKEFHIHDVTIVNNTLRDHINLGCGIIDIKKYKKLANEYNIYCLLELKASEDLKESIVYFKSIDINK